MSYQTVTATPKDSDISRRQDGVPRPTGGYKL